jgi:hypothetical protein
VELTGLHDREPIPQLVGMLDRLPILAKRALGGEKEGMMIRPLLPEPHTDEEEGKILLPNPKLMASESPQELELPSLQHPLLLATEENSKRTFLEQLRDCCRAPVQYDLLAKRAGIFISESDAKV